MNRKHICYGDKHWSTKLSDKHVDLIRKAYKAGRHDIIKAVSEQCGTGHEYTRRVARGNSRNQRRANRVTVLK